MLWNSGANFLIEKSLDIPGSKTDYIKTELNGKAEIYLTKKIEASFDIYTGAVSGNAIPRQEKIFAGGNVDPKHENFVLGYRGSVAPLRSQSMQGGMGLLGYAHNNKDFLKNNAGFSTGAGIKFPYTPIIYGRVGALADKLGKISGQKFFSEAGIKLETPVLSFIFPIWVSDPFGGDKNFDFRFYFNIKDLSLN